MAKAAIAPMVGAPVAAKPKVETISTRQLAAQIAPKHDLSNKASLAILDEAIGAITKHLKKGARVRLNGLGILVVRKRAARMGRNPATGEAIKIKASKKVAFRASKELKQSI
ncbi:MAG: HU family DNA-binding protein [Alphaproteobacteria bacterium]|nr:HU family DNA-binding protein [Alphaproteobacteria bacterium]MDE2630162.1 HU family DNA-binding protein [Alphaproteobacteria bacterium]